MINILLIDHAPAACASLRGPLTELPTTQFRIDSAMDYRAIHEALSSKDFDVCLIDSTFGEGLRLLGHVRSVGCTMPVILVTSNSAAEVLTGIRKGAADCLVRDQLTAAGLEASVCSVVDQGRAVALQDLRERRYLALFDYTDAIIFTCDLHGRFTSSNRAGRLIGINAEEPLTHSLYDLVASEYVTVVQHVMQQATDAQHQTTCEIVLMTKCGDNLSFELSVHPVCRDGRTVELQVIARVVNPGTRAPINEVSRVVGIELEVQPIRQTTISQPN